MVRTYINYEYDFIVFLITRLCFCTYSYITEQVAKLAPKYLGPKSRVSILHFLDGSSEGDF